MFRRRGYTHECRHRGPVRPDDYLRLYNWAFEANLTTDDLPNTGEPIVKKITDHRGSKFDHARPAHELTPRRVEFAKSMNEKTLEKFLSLFDLLSKSIQ